VCWLGIACACPKALLSNANSDISRPAAARCGPSSQRRRYLEKRPRPK
jgi:hypothetical protein